MKRISSGIVATLAALSFAATGCNKDKDKKGEAGAAGSVAGAVAAAGKSATGTFAAFPSDSEFVLSISLASLRSSPLWAQIAPMVQAKMDEAMKDVKATCGLDPVAKLHSFVFGGKTDNASKQQVFVVKGFTRDELSSCGGALAKKEGKEFTLTSEDGVDHLKTDGETVYVVWLDSTTALMTPNPDKAWIKARAAGEGGLDKNAPFMELLGKVDSSATIWFAAMPAAGSNMDLSKNLPGAKGGFGSIKVSDGLGIDGGMRFDTPANATAAHAQATAGLAQAKTAFPMPQLTPLIDKTKLTASGTDVLLQLHLTPADLQAIAAALGPMLGGMMGGMAK